MTYPSHKPFIKVLILSGAALLALTACETRQEIAVRPHMDEHYAAYAPPAPGQNTSPYSHPHDLYGMGKSYLAAGSYGLAINAFRRNMARQGPDVASLNGLAVAYDMLERFDLSQKYYEQALALDRNAPVTYGNLSYSQYLQGHHDNASRFAEIALSLINNGPNQTDTQAIALGKAIADNKALADIKREDPALMRAPAQDSVPGAPMSLTPQTNQSGDFVIQQSSDRHWEVTQKRPEHSAYEARAKQQAGLSVDRILAYFDSDAPKAVEVAKAAEEPEAVEKANHTNDQPKQVVAQEETYRIINGTGRLRMARRMNEFMTANGLPPARLANASHFDHTVSFINYAPGHKDQAQALAQKLPLPIDLIEAPDATAHVELTLGDDLLTFDTSLQRDTYDI